MTDIDLLLAEPEEKDAVVRFLVQFEGSPKTYSYAAVRASTGLWFPSGGDSQGKDWPKLLTWMNQRGGTVVSMEHATTWETLP